MESRFEEKLEMLRQEREDREKQRDNFRKVFDETARQLEQDIDTEVRAAFAAATAAANHVCSTPFPAPCICTPPLPGARHAQTL